MKKLFLLGILFLAGIHSFSQKTISCVIKTEFGDIFIELYPEQAPVTVSNFMRYVDNDLYRNTKFFRVCTPENEAERDIKIQVIQVDEISAEKMFDPIPIETTQQTKLLHKNGTLSMARAEPNSAQCSFSIIINDQPELDFNGKRNPDGQGFAAFGQVTKGMDIVLKIQTQANVNQILVKPILIYNIQRMD
ncbi:MAG: peptidylprolyl isomerase [Bacteroidetes bacterium]|nr:peptidylprolyl isomerase [Bacteroidota bacterium]